MHVCVCISVCMCVCLFCCFLYLSYWYARAWWRRAATTQGKATTTYCDEESQTNQTLLPRGLKRSKLLRPPNYFWKPLRLGPVIFLNHARLLHDQTPEILKLGRAMAEGVLDDRKNGINPAGPATTMSQPMQQKYGLKSQTMRRPRLTMGMPHARFTQ